MRRRWRRRSAAVGLAAVLGALGPLAAAPGAGATAGEVDPGFGQSGVARAVLATEDDGGGFGFGGDVLLATQPDGRILAVASVNADLVVVRFSADGRLDAGFGTNGRVALDLGGFDQASALGVRPDGRIVIAGGTNTSPPAPGSRAAIARLLPTGAPDPSFGANGVVTDDPGPGTGFGFGVSGADVAPDGGVVVVGTVYPLVPPAAVPSEGVPSVPSEGVPSVPSEVEPTVLVVRYDPEGRRDPAFGGGGIAQPDLDSGFVSAVRATSAGAVLAGTTGLGFPAKAPPRTFLARLGPTGALDPAFGQGGRASLPFVAPSFVNELAVAPDGALLAAGQSGRRTAFVARLLANGSPDPAFGDRGRAEFGVPGAEFFAAAALAVTARGAVVVRAGFFGDEGSGGTSLVVIRLLPDGAPDRGFGANGRVLLRGENGPSGGRSLAVQPDEGILLGEVSFGGFPVSPTEPSGPAVAVTRLLGTGPSTPAPEVTTRLAGADRVATSIAASQAAFADARPEGFPESAPPTTVVAAAPVPSAATAPPPAAPAPSTPTAAPPTTSPPTTSPLTTSPPSTAAPTAAPPPGPSPAAAPPAATGRLQAGAVVVARADDYADALVAAPLAAAEDAPVLLTSRDRLDPRVLAEVRRILPEDGDVFLLGGPSALGPLVGTDFEVAGFAVRRFAGADRYETAVRVAERGLGRDFGRPAALLLATGTDFPDALSAGAAAAKVGGAVLLTQGRALPPPVERYLASRPDASRFALGGPAAAADPGATAVVGADRYDTAVRVAAAFFATPATVGVASGRAYPDALSGGARAALEGAPLLLSEPAALPPSVASYLGANRRFVSAAFVVGGPAAVSEAVVSAVGAALRDATG